MKIFISTDMEGISGVTHKEHIMGKSSDYERFRRLMTQEVNAAIEGAIEAGADEIVVNDSHGSMRNIIIEDLNPKARLITGYPKPLVMMEGIDNTFDGAIFIGYHSRASSGGALAHTMSGAAFSSIRINGVEFGETAINAAIAGCFNVPVLMVTGCNILKMEVASVLPETEFVQVKISKGGIAAECLNPKVACELIKEKAKAVVQNKEKCKPFNVNTPIELEVVLNSPTLADVVGIIPGVARISPTTVRYEAEDFITVSKMITTMLNATCVLFMGL